MKSNDQKLKESIGILIELSQDKKIKKQLLLAFGAGKNLSEKVKELKQLNRTPEQIVAFERGYLTYKFSNHENVIKLSRRYKDEFDRFFFWSGYNYCSAHQEAIA